MEQFHFESIKNRLLEYRQAGRVFHEVKMVSLTNCTFDGIVYDVERVMEEAADQFDLVFLWDEACLRLPGSTDLSRLYCDGAQPAGLRSATGARSAQKYAEAAPELARPAGGPHPVDAIASRRIRH